MYKDCLVRYETDEMPEPDDSCIMSVSLNRIVTYEAVEAALRELEEE